MIDRLRRHLDVVVLALLAYLPVLTAAPGRGVADTKLYLFLDPGGLIADARHTWDPQQFGGWVPHQTALYIWPSGPWFWLGEVVGLPDWLTHRLWIGTILLLAGLGIRLAARVLGLRPLAAAVAALVYQLSPYVLPYVSRTSVMLLPWAGLGWIVAYTVRAATRSRWRDSAVVALVVLTVGATNATATLMIAPAPLLWLAWAGLRRDVPWRRVLTTTATIGALSLVVSAWWIVKIAVQGRYGAPVLAYSETLEAVSATSTAPEIARGLGYWLFYVSDPYIATTTAAAPHLQSTRVILANFAVVVVGLLGLVITRWSTRGYAALVVVAGTLLGVGAHTVDDPSALQRILFDDTRSGLALALRSSSRAVPLVTLGLVLGVGALVEALTLRSQQTSHSPLAVQSSRRSRAAAPIAAGLVAVVAVVGLPALTDGGYVDPALRRDDELPSAWHEAAAALDASAATGRVLQLPGQESAAFRWGYTVDPPLPGLSDRPLLARDWLPAGSAGMMDLLYALDDRVQSGVLESEGLTAVARWLGADTVWVAGDIAYDRFDTARPEPVLAALLDAPGLGPASSFGAPVVNEPDFPVVDEDALADPTIGAPLAPVTLLPLDQPVTAARSARDVVIVAGSGDGLVDAAAAGVLDGSEMVRYAADVADADLDAVVASAPLVVITDSNRDRAHQWRGSQDVVGFTEDGTGTGVLVPDPSDERLDVFTDSTSLDRTVADQRGPTRAHASRYGEALRLRPEDRAVMAIDGDPSTAWIVGDRSDPIGQFVEITTDDAVSELRLVQPGDTNRWITSVDVVVDPGTPDAVTSTVALERRSRRVAGQVVELPRAASVVRLVVRGVDQVERPELSGWDGVGFVEVDTGLAPTEEVVRPPLLTVPDDVPAVVVLSRHRVAASDRWRSDPEPSLVRELPASYGTLVLGEVTVRLDRRADDAVLAALVGVDLPVASSRLLGHPAAGGWAAVDGDPTTAWQTAFASAAGATLTIPSPSLADEITLVQRDDGRHSLITGLRIERDGRRADLPVPPPDANGRSRLVLPAEIVSASGAVIVTIAEIEARTTVDRRTFDVVQLPAAVVELEGLTGVALPATFATGCRTDLVSIDGSPLPLRVSGRTAEAFAGQRLEAEPCRTPEPTRGDRIVRGSVVGGLSVDRVVLTRTGAGAGADDGIPAGAVGRDVEMVTSSRTGRTLSLTGCAEGCWVSSGEGRNSGWSARADGSSLGPAVMLNGGHGGWWLPPGPDDRTVTLTWTGQRTVDLALALSALGVVAIVSALVVLRIRRGRLPVGGRSVGPHLHLTPSSDISRRLGLVVTAVAAALGTIAVSASVGATVLLVCLIGLVILRRSRVSALAGLLGVAVCAVVVVERQRSQRRLPDFGWISMVDDLHRPFLAALLVLAASVIAASREER